MRDKRSWRKQWRLWRLGSVERFYYELKENSTYPFEDLGDGFYYALISSDKFMFGLATIGVAIVCFALFCKVIGVFSFPIVLFSSVAGYGIFSMYGNTSTKELIISRYGGYLLRIKGSGKVLVEEPINNVYIKLQRKYDTNALPHYYLILGGYRLDDIRLTGFAVSDGALRILGSGVAGGMGINFFDVDVNSNTHKITHYPGRTLLTPPSQELLTFLRDHALTPEEIENARKLQNLPPKTNETPYLIMNRIKENYGGYTTDRAAREEQHKSQGLIKKLENRETLQTLVTWEDEKDRKRAELERAMKTRKSIAQLILSKRKRGE